MTSRRPSTSLNWRLGARAALDGARLQAGRDVGRLVVWQREQLVDEATVLVVAHREIAAPTVECLFSLVEFGWPIALRYGDALIDRARAKAVSDWFATRTPTSS
jgi:hypothetical protein